MAADKKTIALDVKDLRTGKIMKTIDVRGKSESTIERVLRGLLINMDTENYVVIERTAK